MRDMPYASVLFSNSRRDTSETAHGIGVSFSHAITRLLILRAARVSLIPTVRRSEQAEQMLAVSSEQRLQAPKTKSR